MRKKEIIERLETLNFDKSEYWLVAGAAMTVYGMKQETEDIDMGCTSALADELEKSYPATRTESGLRKFKIGEDVEIFEGWLEDKVIRMDDIPVISVQGLVDMKKKLGREKDAEDLKSIKAFMSRVPGIPVVY